MNKYIENSVKNKVYREFDQNNCPTLLVIVPLWMLLAKIKFESRYISISIHIAETYTCKQKIPFFFCLN